MTVAPAITSQRLLLWAKEILQFGAAASAVLFVALSLLYGKFYQELDLEPENVGLTQAVIVQRALAGVLLIVGLGVLAALALFSSLIVRFFLFKFITWAMTKVAPDSVVAQLQSWGNSAWGQALFSYYYVPLLSPPPTAPWAQRKFLIALGVLATTGALLLAFRVGWQEVNDEAEDAAAGKDATPLKVLGVRVLDIHSVACSALWLGEPEQEPSDLKADDLHCLGSADGTTSFRRNGVTIRVPSSSVALIIR